MAKLLVIGHSFVRRMRERLAGGGLRLARDFAATIIRGFGGMRLESLRQHIGYVKHLEPTLIVVDIGTNDLASPMCCPLALAEAVVTTAKEFAAVPSVRHVVVLQMMPRTKSRRSRPNFNDACDVYNAHVRKLTKKLETVHSWSHRGMVMEWDKYLLPDGVHLNHAGMNKYIRSVRGAALQYRQM